VNLEASFLTSLEKVAENIMTCLSMGVFVKISVISLPMSIYGFRMREVGGSATFLFKQFVAFIENKESQLFKVDQLSSVQIEDSSGGTDKDGGVLGEFFLILFEGDTTVEDLGLDAGQVFAESFEFSVDLVSKFLDVDKDDSRERIGFLGIETLEDSKHEDGGFTHAGLGLADDIFTFEGSWDSVNLD